MNTKAICRDLNIVSCLRGLKHHLKAAIIICSNEFISTFFIIKTLLAAFRKPTVSTTIMPRVCVPVSSTLTGYWSLSMMNESSMAAAMAYESQEMNPEPATNSFSKRSDLDASMLCWNTLAMKRALPVSWANQASQNSCRHKWGTGSVNRSVGGSWRYSPSSACCGRWTPSRPSRRDTGILSGRCTRLPDRPRSWTRRTRWCSPALIRHKHERERADGTEGPTISTLLTFGVAPHDVEPPESAG